MEINNEQTTTVESADVISSEEALMESLGTPTPNAEGGDADIDIENVSVAESTKSDEVIGDGGLPTTNLEDIEGEGETKEENDETQEGDSDATEGDFANVVDYLNTKHELGLNVDALPEDMTREQEAEIVADLFDKVAGNAQSQLNEFSEISKILEDQEVRDFIEAKRSGKTLQDYVKVMSGTPDGMSDEAIITNQLKGQYKDMTNDEVKDLVANYKDKGMLGKMAATVRSNMKENEQYQFEANEKEAQADYDNNVKHVGSLLENTADIYGVPMTDKIKKNVFLAITQRDDEGMTYLDKALQSNDGVIMATLGLLHLKDLMSAKTSTDTNKRNKKLVDKLFSNPKDLQSSNVHTENISDFDSNLANSF